MRLWSRRRVHRDDVAIGDYRTSVYLWNDTSATSPSLWRIAYRVCGDCWLDIVSQRLLWHKTLTRIGMLLQHGGRLTYCTKPLEVLLFTIVSGDCSSGETRVLSL